MALTSLYDINKLGEGDINYLADQAHQRSAGEGMSTFNTAMDQIRFEELNAIRSNTDQSVQDAFKASGIESDEGNAMYYTPIAAINAYLAKQSGAVDDFSQISTDYNKQSIANQGSRQEASVAQGLSIGAEGAIVHSGAGYTDAERGVDVSAPPGTFAVQYANGAVEFRKLPASGRIPTPQEIQASGRAGADVGSVGKEVARTGATIQTKDGVDRKASEGNYLIEYADGTVEERPMTGGFIPSPSQLKAGGTSTTTDPLKLQTLEKEGQAALDAQAAKQSVAQILARGGTAQDAEKAIIAAGLKPTSELEFVGTTYRGKTASKGNAFYVDPKTLQILERPAALSSLAQPLTSVGVAGTSIDVKAKFNAVFGRQPSQSELKYWIGRTDKAGSALIAAMQFAKQGGGAVGSTPGSAVADPVQAIKATANTSQAQLASLFTNAGISKGSSDKSELRAIIENMNAPKSESLTEFTKDQLASSQFQEASNDLNQAKNTLRQLDTDYRNNLVAAERTPGLSMGAIRRNQSELDISYNRERAQLATEVQMYSDIVQSKTAIVGMFIDAFKFDQNTAQQEYTNQFNRAVQMYNMTRQDEQDEFNIQQKLQDNMRSNLSVVTSLLQSGNLQYDQLSSEQKSQIASMEQTVGLPAGFSKFVGQVVKDPVVSFGTAYTDKAGVRRQPVYTTNPTTGAFTTKEIVLEGREKVTGSGGTPTEGSVARTAQADMAAQLNTRRGQDGYISPQDYTQARSQWITRGYSGKVFNDSFRYYANPSHIDDYGIPD